MALRLLFSLVVSVTLVDSVSAEFRVALIIGNSAYQDESLRIASASDLKRVAAGLEKYGFRCETAENLDEKKLKSTIETFAARTPTRSTALIYFSGQIIDGNVGGESKVCLLGINSRAGRGFPLADALQRLSSKGGSIRNLFIASCPKIPKKVTGDLPEGCFLAITNSSPEVMTGSGDLLQTIRGSSGLFQSTLPEQAVVAGKGSLAISPPERFLEGRQAGDEWVNARGIVFCWCPAGTFTAGSPSGTPGRFPDEVERRVTIADGFWISKYELTLSQALRNVSRKSIARHKLDPLTMMNHDDAKSSTTRTLSQAERKAGRLPENWQYSLPTEEQWEYAARAGTKSRFYFGEDISLLPHHANFGDRSYYESRDIFSNSAHRTLNDGAVRLARVGSYQSNPWGLHDVYGNVAEWCSNLAVRGGSWVSVPENCRSAYRDSFSSRNEQNFIGYRLVIQKTPAGTATKK